MNIKSLLLGSAAALVAVSGARAADAVVVAEPEPVEYVRVCDAYGAGYFYIPGTETCLRISGYVRYDAAGGDYFGEDVDGDGEDDTWNKNARFTLRTHTASETELGTLRTYTETRWNFGNVDEFAVNKGTSLNFAYIELGGLRVGKDETAFRTFLGYAGNVISDDIIEPEGYDTNLISYTFTGGNGFSAIASFEQGSNEYTIDSYTPHVVGGLKWAQGWGSIGAVIGYDANVEEYAAKVRADFNITDAFEVFVMGAWQSDGDYANYQDNFYASWGGDWAGWVGASYKFTDKATFNTQVSFDDAEQLAVVANVAYQLVPGFTITPEVVYYKESDDLSGTDDDAWGAKIRFQRSF
ncbi:porin [Phyllobacterium salinisoli]|uniref:Porin n=1 Tax=Phyllobacterium salinisoli TaxID=1899321 RepID=A0A368K1I6_9HYPH|nr:porin [Phyllobacterium salinisoli]RCS23247.1 porin [Phyllobacterium salinisoli]